MTCGQLFLLFCDDLGFCHDETHFSRRINDKILEAALTLAQPKKLHGSLCSILSLLYSYHFGDVFELNEKKGSEPIQINQDSVSVTNLHLSFGRYFGYI